MAKRKRALAQEDLALALGAAGAYLSLPPSYKATSEWLTRMTGAIKGMGFSPMPGSEFAPVARALRETGFADHLANLEDLRDNHDGPFRVTRGDLDELLAAMQMALSETG